MKISCAVDGEWCGVGEGTKVMWQAGVTETDEEKV